MKNFVKSFSEIKVGNIYYWDAGKMFTGIYKGTNTVKVLNIETRVNASSLAEVISIETGEKYFTDIGHLQVNPAILKKKYNTLRRYYKKHNPNLIIKWSTFTGEYKQLVIVGLLSEVNCIKALNKDGVIETFDYSHTKLNLDRNESFDIYQEQQWEDYDDWCYDDFEDDNYFDNDELSTASGI